MWVDGDVDPYNGKRNTHENTREPVGEGSPINEYEQKEHPRKYPQTVGVDVLIDPRNRHSVGSVQDVCETNLPSLQCKHQVSEAKRNVSSDEEFVI